MRWVRSESTASTESRRLRHLFILWIGAFFLHTIADPAATYIDVTILEIGVETNPFIRSWLDKGIGMFVLIHIPLYIFGIIGIMVIRWLFKQGSEREQKQVYCLSIIVLGGINIWGALLVLNNLWLIWIIS